MSGMLHLAFGDSLRALATLAAPGLSVSAILGCAMKRLRGRKSGAPLPAAAFYAGADSHRDPLLRKQSL